MAQSGKFGIKKLSKSSGTLGVFDITSDSQIRIIVENAGPINSVAVYGRIQGQNSYQLIDTVVGSSSKLIEVALFDFLDLEIVSYDSLSNYVDIAGSGFTVAGTSGALPSSVSVTNFPNPQNVAVVNTPTVITDLAAGTPTISNMTLALIGTEYNMLLPVNTKKFTVRVVGYTAIITMGFVSNGTFITIPRGCSYTVDMVLLQSGNRTIYLKTNVTNALLEVVSWV
jgi:hypothetical protein